VHIFCSYYTVFLQCAKLCLSQGLRLFCESTAHDSVCLCDVQHLSVTHTDNMKYSSNNSKSLWKNERGYCPAHLLVLRKLLMLSSTGIGCAFLSMSTTLPRQISQPITKLFFRATEKQVNCTTFQLEVGGRGEPTTANRWNAISHTTRIRMKTHLAPKTKLSKRYWVS